MPRCLVFVLAGLFALSGGVQAQDGGTVAVRQAAEQVLADRYPKRTDNLGVRVRRVQAPIDSTTNLQLDFSQRGGSADGLAHVRIRTKEASGTWEDVGWALLHVTRYDSVATIQRRLRTGETIAPADVSVAWMDVTDFHGEPLRASEFRSLTTQGSLVANRHIQSGRPLREGDVRPPYAVDIGTSVRMHYRRGRVTFRLSCEAREPGFADEVVRVHCPDTRTTYRARVVTQDAVRWIETL